MGPGKFVDLGGELKDVEVAGTKARGGAVEKVNGKEIKQPIDFVKVGGGWLVALPDAKATAAKAAAPKAEKK